MGKIQEKRFVGKILQEKMDAKKGVCGYYSRKKVCPAGARSAPAGPEGRKAPKAPGAPKRARLGLERPFWGPRSALDGLFLAQLSLVGPTG